MNLKNLLLIAFIGIFAMACSQNTNMGKDVKLKSQVDSASYALGADVGTHLNDRNGVDMINYEAFMNGFTDAFKGEEKKLSEEEISSTIQTFLTQAREERNQKILEEGREFLAENKKKEEVKVTESGLQYEVIKEGTGVSPDANDTVKVHYVGKHLDGNVFDSSVERGQPAEFPLNRVIPGWTEGVQLMKEGAKYKFYIPTERAYGKRVRQGSEIKPNEALIFEVELLEVKKVKGNQAQE
jgi:FKBP-type peptidyl-prolyl cis-trans isomerase